MALVQEDGSVVTGANTYVTLAEYKAWADDRGITYGADAAVTQQIYRAMDYIESLRFIGDKANENQPMQWPRLGAIIDGYEVDGNEIPNLLKLAVYEAIKVEADGYSELAALDRRTISESVGDISVTYADNSSSRTVTPALTKALRKLVAPAIEVIRA